MGISPLQTTSLGSARVAEIAPCKVHIIRGEFNELLITRCLQVGELAAVYNVDRLATSGALNAEIILEWANATWLSGEYRLAAAALMADRTKDPMTRIRGIASLLVEVTDSPGFHEALRSRLAYSTGISDLSTDDALRIRNIWRESSHSFKAVLPLLRELRSRDDAALRGILNTSIELMKSTFEPHFVFPNEIAVILDSADNSGGIRGPHAKMSLENQIALPSRILREQCGEFGPYFTHYDLGEYQAIIYHEVAHLISLHALVSKVPALSALLAQSMELDELLDPGKLSGKMLAEEAWQRRAEQGAVLFSVEKTECSIEDLNQHRNLVYEKLAAFEKSFAIHEKIILPYLELFSDLSAVVLTADPACISRCLHEQRAGFRDYGQLYSSAHWSENDPHDVLYPAGCFLYQQLSNQPIGVSVAVLRRLLDLFADEMNRQIASPEEALEYSIQERNDTLIKKLQFL